MDEIILDDLELVEETIQVDDIDLPMLRGLSAYQVAVKDGYTGTEEQWLASLKGDKGDPGEGDMKKSVYDTNNNGVVDNAEKVNNHTVEKDVPSNAVFTDTVYDDTALSGRVIALENAGFITKAVNDLINYYTKSEVYTQAEVNQMVSVIPKFAIEVVQSLPVQDISTTTIYLLITGAETQNLYTEYIYVNNTWEKLGTQTVDLTNYYNKTEVDNLINNIDPLPSGGTVGQVLTKRSNTDGDAQWSDQTGGNIVAIGDNTSVTNDTKLWIDTDELLPENSEVVDSLEGNETTKAPSVRAVKNRFKYSTDEIVVGEWIDGKPIYRKVLNFTTGAQYDNMSKTLINFPNVKMVLKYYGQIQCSDVPRALPHKQSSILIIDATQIRFDIDGDTSGVSGGRTCHLVLEYTKTTD